MKGIKEDKQDKSTNIHVHLYLAAPPDLSCPVLQALFKFHSTLPPPPPYVIPL